MGTIQYWVGLVKMELSSDSLFSFLTSSPTATPIMFIGVDKTIPYSNELVTIEDRRGCSSQPELMSYSNWRDNYTNFSAIKY